MEPKGQNTETEAELVAPREAFQPEPAAVRAQLDRLLGSHHFRNSKRCLALLKYVVDAHLEGALDRVKERIIGSEVFHRDAGYDTNHDSVVRTTAAEVRKRLAQYYLEPGHEEELRLSLPAGSYAPEFRAAAPLSPVVVEVRTNAARFARPVWRFWAAIAAVLVVAGGVWWWQSREPALERFWNPLIEDRGEAVICIGQPLKIYRIEGPRYEELNDKMVGNGTNPPASKDVLENTQVKLSDLRAAGDQYFTFGDLMAAVRISELLARRRKPFQVLGDRIATYYDLRGKPAILLGQFNNRWTQGLTVGVRYYLERDMPNRLYQVRDRQNHDVVIASASQSSKRPEEYAIVSRILNPATERTVVTITGMTFKGTLAGGDFLTNAGYMQEAFRNAPAGWYRKNIQVVLKTAMVGGNAGPPTVVATCFW